MIDYLDHLYQTKKKDSRSDDRSDRLGKTIANGTAKLKSHSRGFQTRQNPSHSCDNGCLSVHNATQINIVNITTTIKDIYTHTCTR